MATASAPNPASHKGSEIAALAVSGLVIALALTSVILRFYTRKFTRVGFGADDWLILAAVIVTLGTAALLIWCNKIDPNGIWITETVHRGHFADTEVFYLRVSYVISVLYFAIAGATKLGILLMYYRIFSVSTAFRYRLFLSIASVIGWWVGCTVAALMNCIPFNWDWNDPDQRRHCFNYNIFWMASGACEILLDLLILTLPVGVIMRMRLSTQRKISISMIFLLGGFVIITGLIKYSTDMATSEVSEVLRQDYPQELVRRCYQARWKKSDIIAGNLGGSTTATETSNIPIIHRLDMERGFWDTNSISIQDPLMRKILNDTLKGYPDLCLEEENWTFWLPFQPLVHRWTKLEEYATKAKADPNTEHAFSGLLCFLTSIVEDPFSQFARIKETGNIDFENIWHLYAPGSLVVSREWDVDLVSRVVRCKKHTSPLGINPVWMIDVEYVDWDGEKCGYRDYSFKINNFDGYRPVTQSVVFPIRYAEDEAGLRAALTEKGRKFEQLRCYKMMMTSYSGSEVWDNKYKKWRVQPPGSRVCVDAFAYYHTQEHAKPKLRQLYDDEEHPSKAIEHSIDESRTMSESSPTPSMVDVVPVYPSRRKVDRNPLTEEQRLMIHQWLRIFDFRTKTWGKVLIDDVQEVDWDGMAIEEILLPEDEKEVLLNFIKGKLRSRNSGLDDFGENKGRGFTCLMSGPPGVGKRYAAGAVADRLRLPLYHIRVADFENNLDELKGALETAVEHCHLLNAILLLTEADILLRTRDNYYMERKDTVYMLLEILKDYTGILFLTTREASDINPAFQSRIDLFLPFNNLVAKMRRQIWQSSITQVGEDALCGSENINELLDELSDLDLNSHEIENVVKNDKMLALGSGDSGRKISKDMLCLLAKNRILFRQASDTRHRG
ncbi:hypothetical protein F4774DRAFT_428242 [Daldinia eschscholtzii]|nr:hypothetical protein F4774DRAFT_428242 [Daldinia eschscholtzii]